MPWLLFTSSDWSRGAVKAAFRERLETGRILGRLLHERSTRDIHLRGPQHGWAHREPADPARLGLHVRPATRSQAASSGSDQGIPQAMALAITHAAHHATKKTANDGTRESPVRRMVPGASRRDHWPRRPLFHHLGGEELHDQKPRAVSWAPLWVLNSIGMQASAWKLAVSVISVELDETRKLWALMKQSSM